MTATLRSRGSADVSTSSSSPTAAVVAPDPMPEIMKRYYDPQTRDGFQGLLDMLQLEKVTVSDSTTGAVLKTDELAKRFISAAERSAGVVKLIDGGKIKIATDLYAKLTTCSREDLAQTYAHRGLKETNKKDVLFKKMNRLKTYNAALEMYNLGLNEKTQDQWMDSFSKNMLYISAGRLTGDVTETKEATIKLLKRKYKLSPPLKYNLEVMIFTHGNLAMTYVNNRTQPSDKAFVLAGLTFFDEEDDGNGGKVVRPICNVDLINIEDAVGAIAANTCVRIKNWVSSVWQRVWSKKNS